MAKLLIFLAGLTAALLLSGCEQSSNAVAASAVYYVAPDGNDANPGTEAQPWRTIGKAASTLTAGDTVYIRAGTYYERVVPQNSGRAGQFITYAAYPGETATIDGTGVDVPEYSGLFDLTGRDYIRVAGLRVIHSGYYGIVADNSSHITIEHNYTYDTYSSGISAWNSNNIIVDGNEVVGACTGLWQEHISISSTDTFEVRHNRIHDVMPGTEGKEGLSVKDASSHGKVYGNQVYNLNHVGIYVDAEAEHLLDVAVYQNVVHDIPAMGFSLASEQGGLLENVRLYNNVAYNNLVGLWLSACCIATHPFQNISIINNTFAYNGRDGWGGGIGIENTQVGNVVIRNNICSQNVYSQMAADPSVLPELTVDHNLTDGDRDPEFEFYGVGDLVDVSPSFVNPLMRDYHLLAGSPAINQGSSNGAPLDDFDGLARDAQPDIGAYEWRQAEPTSTPTMTPTPTSTPTGTPTVTATPTATPTAPLGCFYDVNANGIVDVADIVATGARIECWTYLPTIVSNWRRPWPTATPTATPSPTLAPETRPDGATRLTTPPAGASDQNPAFSPDGTRIVFTCFENGYNAGPAGLFLLNLGSRQVARLTPWEDQDNVNLPGAAWNPANNRIIFASDRAEANDLWCIAPDGTDFSRITTHAGQPWYIEPSWSPDGQLIVFEARQPGQSEDGLVGKIWKVRADGSGLAQLTDDPGFDDRQPNWSPDGHTILFQRRPLPAGDWDIWTMQPNGTGLQNVTNDPTGQDTDASWSPDDRQIVYSSDHGGLPVPNIFTISATGGTPRRVTTSSTNEDGAASWSPDGRWIAFESHAPTVTGHSGPDETSPAALWRIAAPAAATPTPTGTGTSSTASTAYLRLNQVGYLPGETKIALALTDENLSGQTFSAVADPGGSIALTGHVGADRGAYGDFAHLYELDFTGLAAPGTYRLRLGSNTSPVFNIGANAYADLIPRTLQFFRVQRCGNTAPALHGVCHLKDGMAQGGPVNGAQVDATGGWHDAGDYLKFLITTGATTDLMLAAYQRHPDVFADGDSNGVPDLLDEARVGLDWMLKMWDPAPAGGVLYYQVGDISDHERPWRMPEGDDVDYPARPVWACEPGKGANVAGKAAAALALAASLWNDPARTFYSPTLASTYRTAAQQIYEYGQARPAAQSATSGFYEETSWQDDLALAAAELYRATGNATYLSQARAYAAAAGNAWTFGYAEMHGLAHYEIARLDSTYVAAATAFLVDDLAAMQAQANANPFRAAVSQFDWGSAEMMMGAALEALWYEDLSGNTTYHTLAQVQRDYVLGGNPWGVSFVNNIGTTWPHHPHHQVADLTHSELVGFWDEGPVARAGWEALGITLKDPDLYAAFQSDAAVYHDDVEDYATNEPTIIANALGLALAAWYTVPASGNPTATPSATSSPTLTPMLSPSPTGTPTPTGTPAATRTATPSATSSATLTPRLSPGPTGTPTVTYTATPSAPLYLPVILKGYVPLTTPTRTATVTATPAHTSILTPTPTPSATLRTSATPRGIWKPAPNTSWQWQLTDTVDQSFDVVMYDIDMFDNSAAVVAALHAQGRKVVCYVSVGSWENWRPDANQFPAAVIGNDYAGWPGEKWLDIRRLDLLGPIMRNRMDQCQAKGFDALEPDNIDGYANDTGFPLTYQDQLNYNLWLANEAHARGLSIALKNDLDQVNDLLPHFDWALSEDCFYYQECSLLTPFINAGKAVFDAEYTDTGLTLDQFCPTANAMNINAILKHRGLDAWRQACR
jgi:Tol biopolymer transport system component